MVRLIGYFFGIGAVFALLAAGAAALYISRMSEGLPDYQVLAKYEPPVTTRFHASDGALMAEYARERRLFLPIQAIPQGLKDAFLSAEDKSFYHHPGIDIEGVARAAVILARGGPMQGGSTITQQVAKNFLLTNERSMERKVKEAILALRIEQAYSKDRILELYLNEIYLGMGAYGVAAASLAYFDKGVTELDIHEAAYLAALPKAPENYNPFRNPEAAIGRRNWVIARMLENGVITAEQAADASAKPLDVNPRPTGTYLASAEYFTEEVRRQIIARYGVDELYEGGLSVRTTLDPEMQVFARAALQHALVAFDQRKGWRGPVEKVSLEADWAVPLGAVRAFSDVPEWRLAIVLSSSADSATLGLQPPRAVSGQLGPERDTTELSAADMQWALGRRGISEVLEPGDVVYLEAKPDGAGYLLRQPPKVEGALVAMDPHTGRVKALVGGFSYAESEFNRATQALRQPGSSFKPIVYAAALDNGYTPASVILDGPISISDGRGNVWEPKNYGGTFAGPSTLRLGIEKSRNLMTVRLAQDMGMDLVAEYAQRFGVYDRMGRYLPMSLGSGETTVMRMVSAYAVMANGGRSIEPSLIDRVQDRYGLTVYKHDGRRCDTCSALDWENQPEPELVDTREQVLDPMTAYQITSMMEGVVQRGTATSVNKLGRPVAGKTGTTNDVKDAWFVGYTPDLVTGVYIGYDNPASLGDSSTGGSLAAPIFTEFMTQAVKDMPVADFRIPDGMTQIAVDMRTGMAAGGTGPGTVLEAFKPGTGPSDVYSVIGESYVGAVAPGVSQRAQEAIGSGQGGLF
ncbi:penicillin-binding protein 1A [Aureimonas fodinaquatilis]|uniref:Penicillin-binding protein 1A n=1 Tax=Aureimonas fodinaquatilis TaxID=2565783 RepID=A0A5B0DVP9_9HYPH|nr:penicillin-binding protein 1A [Aureimonas fodinaquatilis]KAA0970556.1 penicillin-binding protein 1A [Aureimonas fodinaquatilis]